MNVLIVEDQCSMRLLLRGLVEGSEYAPTPNIADFGNPLDALSWSDSNGVDLLLVDYRMPQMDGLTFTRHFRQRRVHCDAAIIMVTVVNDDAVRLAALNLGMIDVLIKPVRPCELHSQCENLLSARQFSVSMNDRARFLERQLFEDVRQVNERQRELIFGAAQAIQHRDFGTDLRLLRMAHIARMFTEALGTPHKEWKWQRLAISFIGDWLEDVASRINDLERIAVDGHWTTFRHQCYALKVAANIIPAQRLVANVVDCMRLPDWILRRKWRDRVEMFRECCEDIRVDSTRIFGEMSNR